MKLFIKIIALGFILTILSCHRIQIEKKIDVPVLGANAQVELYQLKLLKTPDKKNATLIRAIFKLVNTTDDTIKVNLDSLKLYIQASKCIGPYIDSMVDIMIQTTVLPPGDEYKRKIYWAMNGIVDKSEVREIAIRYIQ